MFIQHHIFFDVSCQIYFLSTKKCRGSGGGAPGNFFRIWLRNYGERGGGWAVESPEKFWKYSVSKCLENLKKEQHLNIWVGGYKIVQMCTFYSNFPFKKIVNYEGIFSRYRFRKSYFMKSSMTSVLQAMDVRRRRQDTILWEEFLEKYAPCEMIPNKIVMSCIS